MNLEALLSLSVLSHRFIEKPGPLFKADARARLAEELHVPKAWLI
jgi:hypothetical protein